MDAGLDPEKGWEGDGCDGERGDDEGMSPCEIVRYVGAEEGKVGHLHG